jgi:hypothetical protein
MSFTQNPAAPFAIDPVTGQPVAVQAAPGLPVQQPAPQTVPVQPLPQVSEFGPGVTPPQPRFVGDTQPVVGQQLPPVQLVQAPGQAPQVLPMDVVQQMLGQAREDEKAKLYSRMEELGSQVQTLAQEREARLAAEKAAEEAAAAARKLEEEQSLDAKELVERVRQESAARVADLENKIAIGEALREKEEMARQLDAYRDRLLIEMGEHVMPELRDFIKGNTKEEIDTSFQEMINRTAQIVGGFQSVMGAQPIPGASQIASAVPQQAPLSEMRGVSSSGAFPVGPLEQGPATQTLDPGQIRNMSMEEFRANRDRLHAAATQQFYQGGQ